MGLDIRWPIGIMFSLIGALLVVFGVATNSDTALYARALNININLIWGVVLLVFGILMLLGAVRGRKKGEDRK
jgi:protein-S-isoprenylcysteine O-methyltransferase Ste14